jgi:cytoskeletal protein CcmA (bactofilin family)
MWPFRDARNAIPTFNVENTIGADSRVRGDLSGPGGFRVEGAVEGSIDSDGPVVVGEQGTVEGGVRGRDVVVLGRVRGDVRVSGHLEVGPKGKILGDITVQSFRMHKGGVFRGASCMPTGEEALAIPAVAIRVGSDELQRGRTLPPPNGAVPPPPTHADLTAIPILPDESVSEERLITSGKDEALPNRRARATGT